MFCRTFQTIVLSLQQWFLDLSWLLILYHVHMFGTIRKGLEAILLDFCAVFCPWTQGFLPNHRTSEDRLDRSAREQMVIKPTHGPSLWEALRSNVRARVDIHGTCCGSPFPQVPPPSFEVVQATGLPSVKESFLKLFCRHSWFWRVTTETGARLHRCSDKHFNQLHSVESSLASLYTSTCWVRVRFPRDLLLMQSSVFRGIQQ